jgi:uncharacterized protein YceK
LADRIDRFYINKELRKMNRYVTGIFLSIILLLSGCASVPMASVDADKSAKAFTAPSDGSSNLYIYRNESMGSAIKLPLLLDGVAIGDTAAHTYVLKTVQPGKHVLTSKGEKDSTFDLDVTAGENYFFWQEVKMGMMAARSELHLVDEAAGKKGVGSCKLIK